MRIPCVLMRGGSSKGLFFLAKDLPADPAARDRLLLAAMGSPDARQIDGMGGGNDHTLSEYAKFHFAYEQALMTQYAYPGVQAHSAAHGHLNANSRHFKTRLHKGGDLFVLQTIKDWLLDHIVVEDKPLASFLRDQGIV